MLVNLFSEGFFNVFVVWDGKVGEGGGGGRVGSGGSMNIKLKTSLELQPPSIRLSVGSCRSSDVYAPL